MGISIFDTNLYASRGLGYGLGGSLGLGSIPGSARALTALGEQQQVLIGASRVQRQAGMAATDKDALTRQGIDVKLLLLPMPEDIIDAEWEEE